MKRLSSPALVLLELFLVISVFVVLVLPLVATIDPFEQ